jgi:alkylated DNA repair protein alkB family protein 1
MAGVLNFIHNQRDRVTEFIKFISVDVREERSNTTMKDSSSAAATKEEGIGAFSVFKQKLTYHKRRGSDPNKIDDLEEAIDASLLLSSKSDADRLASKNDRLYPVRVASMAADTIDNLYDGPWFGIRGFPGFFLAPQAIDEQLQMEMAYKAVSEWCEAPHRTNMDLQPVQLTECVNGKDETMWSRWKNQRQSLQNTPTAKKRKSHHDSNTKSVGPTKYYRSFKKLSWATLGYHYNWTKRSYSPDEKSPMPPILEQMATRFARTSLLLEQSSAVEGKVKEKASLTFDPTASIINYYSTKSVMGGHQDDLELALDKPIVSISLGLPAVFLLGGKSKEEDPVVAILLRPGDVVCLGGASRLNFHAMARILPLQAASKVVMQNIAIAYQKVTWQSCLSHKDADAAGIIPKEELDHLKFYLQEHRININVRQVYPDDFAN